VISNHVDLTSCEQEPIHLIGSIQSHGVLLAIEGDDLQISPRALLSTLANVLSAFFTRVEDEQYSQHVLSRVPVQARLLDSIDLHKNVASGLLASSADLLALTNASGCAVRLGGKLTTIGLTPPDQSICDLLEWLGNNAAAFQTQCLSSVFPGGTSITKFASGILATPVPPDSGSWILWFRPEAMEEVLWAGNPHTATELEKGQLNPRESFETWKELTQGKSPPCGAKRLLNFLLDGASEPLSDSLRALLSALRDSSTQQLKRINSFVDVLRYEDSPVDHSALSEVELKGVIAACIEELLPSATTKRVTIRTRIKETAETVIGEPTALSRLLLILLENAIKFSPDSGVVELWVDRTSTQIEIHIKDNGPGISEENQGRCN
jgi:light-regulated signal transduction histidine kinase (bacteriophytochrome)